MSDTTDAAICPGQASLLRHGHPHYLRAAFSVYWNGAAPSTEIFYLHSYPPFLNKPSTNALETEVAGILGGNVVKVTYLGFEGFELTDAEVAAEGARVISGPPASLPATALVPTPEPTPTPSPPPAIAAQIAPAPEPF